MRAARYFGGSKTDRLACCATLALFLAAMLPPIIFILVPRVLALLGPPSEADTLVALLLLVPGITGLAAARLGLRRINHRFRSRPDKEHALAIFRILVQALIFAYAVAVALTAPQESSRPPGLLISATALAAGWVVLLLIVLRPGASALRRYWAIGLDVALLSAFLHFSDGNTAVWYSLYLLLVFYAGFRLGVGALIYSAALSALGFTLVVALTPFWRDQLLLSMGLVAAMIVVPACIARLLQAVAASEAAATAATAARSRSLAALGQALREPLEAMSNADGGRGIASDEASQTTRSARSMLAQIGEVLDLAAIEAGAFSPRIESIDLHALINDIVEHHRPEVVRKGLVLQLRVDPTLPFQLRGPRQQVSHVLNNVVGFAIEAADQGAVRIVVGGHTREHKLDLQITVRHRNRRLLDAAGRETLQLFSLGLSVSPAERIEPQADSETTQPRLTAATRLTRFIGGELHIDDTVGDSKQITLTLPLSIDAIAPEIILDLARRPVLVVTEDSRFAGDLAEVLNAWRADVRWIGGCDAAATYLERATLDREPGSARPVLIIDGRTHLLPTLSFAHHAAGADGEPPFILFVAEAAQIDGIAELAAGAFDSLLAAPLNDDLLGSALHALPLVTAEAAAPRRTGRETPPEAESAPTTASPVPASPASAPVERVTPIAAHPRFAPDAAGILDTTAIGALRELGVDDRFFHEVIDSFRTEARLSLDRIRRAVADVDIVAFAGAVNALRRGAITVGGTRLAELLLTIARTSAAELREQGAAYAQRINAEFGRLEVALLDVASASETQQL
jgi:signal transduction histidine kinase